MGNLLQAYRQELRSSLELALAAGCPTGDNLEAQIAALRTALSGCEPFFEGTYREYHRSSSSPDHALLAVWCGLRELRFTFLAQDPRKELEELRKENNRYRNS